MREGLVDPLDLAPLDAAHAFATLYAKFASYTGADDAPWRRITLNGGFVV